jgi:23S rRNA (cytidine1920-2'-O)/16S rRNA (cytidine1409-2'-O)-methyltransferase
MTLKKRLDQIIGERHPELSRTIIQSLITQGKVTVEGTVVTKAGQQYADTVKITVDAQLPKYVSRAGFKLEKALDYFNIDVKDKVALDAGLSTGGFTDCLLQRGIARVYGVDVGYGQVHEKIRNDARVVVMEKTNLRNLDTLPELVDIVTLDLSFISVLKVIDVVRRLMKDKAGLVVLIKPQFEAGKHQVGKGGIVRDAAVHEQVVKDVVAGIESHGFTSMGTTDSPIEGSAGNKEFLAYFLKK